MHQHFPFPVKHTLLFRNNNKQLNEKTTYWGETPSLEPDVFVRTRLKPEKKNPSLNWSGLGDSRKFRSIVNLRDGASTGIPCSRRCFCQINNQGYDYGVKGYFFKQKIPDTRPMDVAAMNFNP